jgi:hypothetical protein
MKTESQHSQGRECAVRSEAACQAARAVPAEPRDDGSAIIGMGNLFPKVSLRKQAKTQDSVIILKNLTFPFNLYKIFPLLHGVCCETVF